MRVMSSRNIYMVTNIFYCFSAAEFAAGSRSVQVSEPDGATASSISLTVERTGGPMGVVSVSWSITTDSGRESRKSIILQTEYCVKNYL